MLPPDEFCRNAVRAIEAKQVGPISCRRRIRATHCITPIVLYTKADVQRDKLATIVDQTKLTAHAVDDVLWRKCLVQSLRQSSSEKLATLIFGV